MIKIEDEDGNIVLYYSIFICFKFVFRVFFFLFELKDGREMFNIEGKSVLEIVLEMELSGMFKGK